MKKCKFPLIFFLIGVVLILASIKLFSDSYPCDDPSEGKCPGCRDIGCAGNAHCHHPGGIEYCTCDFVMCLTGGYYITCQTPPPKK